MSSNVPTKLTGERSRRLFEEIQSLDQLKKSEHVLRFFQGLDGQEEFWAMAHILKGDGPGADTEKLRVHHISDVSAAYSSKAQALL